MDKYGVRGPYGYADYVTISRAQLIQYMREHSRLAKSHLFKGRVGLKSDHDLLRRVGSRGYWKYQLFVVDNGQIRVDYEYDDLAEAAAALVSANSGLWVWWATQGWER